MSTLSGFALDQLPAKPFIVAFIGTVGSGKSTQMKLLAMKMRSKGLKIRTTNIKVGHLWTHPLYVIALKKQQIFRNRHLFKLWVTLDVVAISLKFLVSVYLPYKRGYIVLVEEYLPSIITDYLFIARMNNHPYEDLRRIMVHIVKLMSLTHYFSVILDADDTTLIKRWIMRGTPMEKPQYLAVQRNLLFSLAKRFSRSFVLIDTSNMPIKETSRHIMDYLIKEMASRL